MEHGCAGIGAYWCVVEQLYEQDGVLPLSCLNSIAFALRLDVGVIEGIINNFDLFRNDGTNFWSESVNTRRNKIAEISEKRRNAGRKGGAPSGNKNAAKNDETSKNKHLLEKNKQKQANKIKENKYSTNIDSTNVNCSNSNQDSGSGVAGATAKTKNPKNELEKRAKEFGNLLVPFIEKYNKEMIRKFYDYWTEPNKSYTKMRFEKESTWELSRRLKTWADREPIISKGDTSQLPQEVFIPKRYKHSII